MAVESGTPSAPDKARLFRFGRSTAVGACATLLDLGALTLALRVGHWQAGYARLLGLVLGALVLFFGNRGFAFRAQAGSLRRQAWLFVASELLGLPINLAIFSALGSLLRGLPAEAVSLIANFVAFVSYHYPVRSLIVFRTPATPKPVLPPGS